MRSHLALVEPSAQDRTRDPRQYLADYWPTVAVTTTQFEDPSRNGLTRWRPGHPPEILISQDLDDVGERATLTHEMMHVERGPVDEHQRPVEEAEVDRLAARWLLPDVTVIREALCVPGGSVRTAAAALQVPRKVLVNRLRNLSIDETYLVHDRA